jgi:hypothetical protein
MPVAGAAVRVVQAFPHRDVLAVGGWRGGDGDDLPSHVQRLFDDASGAFYYCDATTQTSSWTRPAASRTASDGDRATSTGTLHAEQQPHMGGEGIPDARPTPATAAAAAAAGGARTPWSAPLLPSAVLQRVTYSFDDAEQRCGVSVEVDCPPTAAAAVAAAARDVQGVRRLCCWWRERGRVDSDDHDDERQRRHLPQRSE